MNPHACPNCGDPSIVPGVASGEAGIGFIPGQVRFWRIQNEIRLPEPFFACISCGHTWTRIDPDQLRDFIRNHGREVLKQRLFAFEVDPKNLNPGLPGFQEAAGCVEAMDALVLAGRITEATRTYRQLSGQTWDDAIAAVRDWPDLDRASKLARFGWQPKHKPDALVPRPADHPMGDAWLDVG